MCEPPLPARHTTFTHPIMTAKFWYGNYIRLGVLAVFAFTLAFWSVVSCYDMLLQIGIPIKPG